METVIDTDGQIITKILYDDGYISYHNAKGQTHRIGGPAVIYSDGAQEYYVNGKRHRSDGPAYIDINKNGYQIYYTDDKIHRIGGHAVVNPDGSLEYWVDDIQYNEEEYPKAVLTYKLKQLVG